MEDHPRLLPTRWLLGDIILWFLALDVARWFRHDFDVSLLWIPDLGTVLTVAIILGAVVLIGIFSGLYSAHRRVWPGSRTEDLIVAAVHFAAGVIGTVAAVLFNTAVDMGRSVPVAAAVFVIAAAILGRALWRWLGSRWVGTDNSTRTIVVGAGARAQAFLAQTAAERRSNSTSYVVVGIVSQDPRRVGAILHGTKVRAATTEDLLPLIDRTGATTLLLAPDESPSPSAVQALRSMADELDMHLLVLPAPEEIGDEHKQHQRLSDQVRDIDIRDLLGRDPVELDENAIRSVIAGHRVLVTGAGGSIGSELARQVDRFDPGELILLDRDEGGLHATQLSLTNQALLDGDSTVLADIRDRENLIALFKERKPEIVFHAAALKHLPLLETYPAEAVKTNVVGSQNVLDAAAACGSSIVVNVSTDKAANPTSVLGESKRIAERLTARMGEEHEGTWVSVRFGNVLGSRGSVISTFQRQIEVGGPVTVTDPKVERYFMTIPEASQLVLQAAAVGASGETLVLDMGEPVRIGDLARQLIELSNADVDIVYTGLREGEKLSEDLFDEREQAVHGDRHPLVSEVAVDRYTLPDDLLSTIASEWSDSDVRTWLTDIGGRGPRPASPQSHHLRSTR